MDASKLRVAVIGAGSAGLCSARHILSRPLIYEPPVVFEMTGGVGGTWAYTEVSDTSTPVPSSMYRGMKTNLPKEIMEFPDFAFDPSLPSFIHNSEVLKYLEDYTDHFSIRPHIKFNTCVVLVSPLPGEEETRVSWDVTTKTQGEDRPVTERFDAVIVCVGHYSLPYMPDIEGIEKFQGQVLHSHYYRFPEVFSSCSVVLLGAGASGIDIALELSPVAKHVTLSHRGPPLKWTPPENVSLVPPVVRATPTSLICEDGTEIVADTFMYCTGYKYYYPFLLPGDDKMPNQQKVDSEKGVEQNGPLKSTENLNMKVGLPRKDLLEGEDVVGPDVGQGHLPPVYRHIIHARYPTMCFLGHCKIAVPFPLYHCQAQFFLSVLEGKCRLPPPAQMLSEFREEVRNARKVGIRLKYLHLLGPKQWEYNQWLADAAGFEPLPPVLGKLHYGIRDVRKCHPVLYRQLSIRILNREEYEMKGELVKDYQGLSETTNGPTT